MAGRGQFLIGPEICCMKQLSLFGIDGGERQLIPAEMEL